MCGNKTHEPQWYYISIQTNDRLRNFKANWIKNALSHKMNKNMRYFAKQKNFSTLTGCRFEFGDVFVWRRSMVDVDSFCIKHRFRQRRCYRLWALLLPFDCRCCSSAVLILHIAAVQLNYTSTIKLLFLLVVECFLDVALFSVARLVCRFKRFFEVILFYVVWCARIRLFPPFFSSSYSSLHFSLVAHSTLLSFSLPLSFSLAHSRQLQTPESYFI